MTKPDPTIVCGEDDSHADVEANRLKEWFTQLSAHLNAFTSERVACRYQMESARTGRFRITSPFDSGRTLSCFETACMHEAFAFHFHDASETFWLITAETAQAYEISGAFFPKRNLYLTVKPHFKNSVRYWNSVLPAIEDKPSGTRFDHSGSTLVIGHVNYAHFFWNQLPALLELEELDEIDVDTIVVTNEPILPIRQLVALKCRNPPVHGSPSTIRGDRGLHPGLVFAMGSSLVTDKTKQRLIERCTRYADDLGAMGFEKRGVVIWASLRLRDRHAINIADALLEIFRKLETEKFEATVLLDGFSEPNDITVPQRYRLDLVTSQRRAIRELARGLTARVRDARFEHVTVIDIANFDTPAAIAAARNADIYFCHHGTQQHKVGWIYDIPGVIHANRSISDTHPGHWKQLQSNSPYRPVYVPKEFITDVPPKNDLQSRNSYYHDYEFENLEGLAEYFYKTLREQLELDITPS